MNSKKPESILFKLRNRKIIPKSITPASASSVIRTYIQPRLNRDYVISSRQSLIRSHCSSPQGSSTPSISNQLTQDLSSTFSTLSYLKHQLESTLNEKQNLLKRVSDYNLANNQSQITIATLNICLNKPKLSEKKYKAIKEYEKLVEVNRNLRKSVETEQGVNNIRLFFIYFF